jgi:hypothetical protein
MPSQFDTVGMPSLTQNEPVSGGLQDTQRANPLGDQVDNTVSKNAVAQKAQGASSNQGAYIEMQARPSWLY